MIGVPGSVPAASQHRKYLSLETCLAQATYLGSQQNVGFILEEDAMKKILITTAMFSVLALSPASAGMMSCSGANMAKTNTAMMGMADGPAKMGMGKEMGMTNTEMSKGNMGGACMHYMKAQKMGMMKS
jgi:hypothetical protein